MNIKLVITSLVLFSVSCENKVGDGTVVTISTPENKKEFLDKNYIIDLMEYESGEIGIVTNQAVKGGISQGGIIDYGMFKFEPINSSSGDHFSLEYFEGSKNMNPISNAYSLKMKVNDVEVKLILPREIDIKKVREWDPPK